jgi:hypothetical protein
MASLLLLRVMVCRLSLDGIVRKKVMELQRTQTRAIHVSLGPRLVIDYLAGWEPEVC